MNFKNIKKKIVAEVTLLVTSIIFAGVGGGFLILAHNTIDQINYKSLTPTKEQEKKEEQELGEVSLDIDDSRLLTDPMILNVLILGIDKNGSDTGRSDSIILMSIDSRHKKLKLTSFMRDTWAEIPGYYFDKLNHAYAYGGESLIKETVEKNFGIKIDRCISIDFVGFKDIIEVFSGIDMELTDKEVSYINKWSRDNNFLEVSNGVKHLSPLQALCHVRNRTLVKKDSNKSDGEKLSDDFARASRQRDFFRTIFTNLKSCNLGQILSIISKVGPKITTNFKKSEIMNLVPKSLIYLKYPVTEYALPEAEDYSDATKRGMSVLEIQDIKRLRYKLACFIYEKSLKERPDILRGEFRKKHVFKNDYEQPHIVKKKMIPEKTEEGELIPNENEVPPSSIPPIDEIPSKNNSPEQEIVEPQGNDNIEEREH